MLKDTNQYQKRLKTIMSNYKTVKETTFSKGYTVL